MWLDGVERKYIDECGVMNVFFVMDSGDGPRVITPPLGGTILPGVTRDSALTLLREMGIPVAERRVAIEELIETQQRGTLKEVFGTGTAATLSHIRSICYRGRRVDFAPIEQRPIGTAVRDRLVAIASGKAPDNFSWLERL